MTGCALEAVTVGHADGRDLVDIALSEALVPVLRDLGTCGAPVGAENLVHVMRPGDIR